MRYEWHNSRNAVGFAAACAREALRFYEGKKRDAVVKAIEIAEAYSRGEEVLLGVAAKTAQAAANPTYGVSYTASRVAHAAASAAYGVSYSASYSASRVAHAPHVAFIHAVGAGVPPATLDRLRTCWIVKDLGADPDTEIGHAMYALVSIGEYAHAARLWVEEWAA